MIGFEVDIKATIRSNVFSTFQFRGTANEASSEIEVRQRYRRRLDYT